MKYLIFSVLVFLTSSTSFAKSMTSANWGTKRANVEKKFADQKVYASDKNSIIYQTDFGGLASLVAFGFTNGLLDNETYYVTTDKLTVDGITTAGNALVKKVREAYGKPIADSKEKGNRVLIWRNKKDYVVLRIGKTIILSYTDESKVKK